jgi:hypothetical protein
VADTVGGYPLDDLAEDGMVRWVMRYIIVIQKEVCVSCIVGEPVISVVADLIFEQGMNFVDHW